MARLAATINGLFALPRVLVLMDGGAGIISNDELADLPFLLRIGGGATAGIGMSARFVLISGVEMLKRLLRARGSLGAAGRLL